MKKLVLLISLAFLSNLAFAQYVEIKHNLDCRLTDDTTWKILSGVIAGKIVSFTAGYTSSFTNDFI